MLKGSRSLGVSLIEVLVVLAIVGVAAGAVTRVAITQQRTYGRLAARSLALGQVREGADVLAAELAGISSAAGDIYEGGLGHAAIEFRAPIATAISCTRSPSGASDIDLARLSAVADSGSVGGATLGDSWISAGDSIWLHDPRADTTDAPVAAAWRGHLIVATSRVRQRCIPVDDSADVELVRARIEPPVATLLEAHSPARIFRRVRYALYRAADGMWYLGFSDCRPLVRSPACAPTQPVAGPYLPDAGPERPEAGGVRLEYLDARGAPTADRLDVAAIRLRVVANASSHGSPLDTVATVRAIGLRNSPP